VSFIRNRAVAPVVFVLDIRKVWTAHEKVYEKIHINHGYFSGV
jgi:hypothetical protein